jgi:hypothetical protein
MSLIDAPTSPRRDSEELNLSSNIKTLVATLQQAQRPCCLWFLQRGSQTRSAMLHSGVEAKSVVEGWLRKSDWRDSAPLTACLAALISLRILFSASGSRWDDKTKRFPGLNCGCSPRIRNLLMREHHQDISRCACIVSSSQRGGERHFPQSDLPARKTRIPGPHQRYANRRPICDARRIPASARNFSDTTVHLWFHCSEQCLG